MPVSLRLSPPVAAVLLAGALTLSTVPAGAQEAEAPAGTPEMAAAMEAMAKAGTPGEPHQHLAEMAGTWTSTVEFWMDPAGGPTTSVSTAERTMILGGRVLQERATGTVMGESFEGLGFAGYDNVTGEWWSIWTDNMSTGLMVMTGERDEESGTIVYEGEMSDPLTGGRKPVKMVVRSEGPDKEIGEMFEPGPDGEMVRTMRVVSERQE